MSKTIGKVPFPSISQKAVNEFDANCKLHFLAFPWLFPGGHGDLTDALNVDITKEEWVCTLLQMKDGIFSTDGLRSFAQQMFCPDIKTTEMELSLLMSTVFSKTDQPIQINSKFH